MTQAYKISPRDEAKEKLLSYIIENQLQVHDRLPSERDLCAMWAYNRVTLRSAIAALIEDGVIYNKKGSGTFVAPEKLKRDLQDLSSLTEVVNRENRTLETIVLSMTTLEANKQICKHLKLMLGSPVIELVRLRLIDAIPAMIETTYLDAIRFKALLNEDFSIGSLYKSIEEHYGLKPHYGHEKIGITSANEVESHWLKVQLDKPLFYMRGIVYDQYDEPLEYFKSVVRNDQVRFASKLVRE